MFDIIKTILEVGKSLFGLRAEFEKISRDRRDRLVQYFSDIATLLEEVSALLRTGEYPHGKCAELGALADLMPQTLAGLLPDEDIQTNKDKLRAAHEVELLYSQLDPLMSEESQKRLVELDEAAGQFRALVAHLRVTSSD